MELEFDKTEWNGCETVTDTTLFCEETLECIVPDACPDMLRILDTDGVVCLKSREASEGRAELRGVVRCSVLYLPDGEEGVRRVEVTIPFACGCDDGGIRPGCLVHAAPRLLSADARMLNPRKLYVRAEVAADVRIYAPSAMLLSRACVGGEEWGVQERRELCPTYAVRDVKEKAFTFSDDLSLPGSKPDMEEILRERVELTCAESKVIGAKLVFKGQAALTVLYRSVEQQVVSVCFELPFSQLMEVEGAGEEADCDVAVTLGELNCQRDPEDGRLLSVSMDLMAQAVLREEGSVEVVTDLYSTAYGVTVQSREDQFCRLSEGGSRRQPVREVLETPVGVKSVVDCTLAIGAVSQSWEGTLLTLTADVRATVLYVGEDDGLYALTRPVNAACQWEPEPGCRCACRCQCPGELYATPTVGGVEVRFPLDFHYRAETRRTVLEVAGATLDEEHPLDTAGRPSIVLRMVEAGESLWEIAKTYATTQAEIMGANELAGEEAPAGKLLLIPKKR